MNHTHRYDNKSWHEHRFEHLRQIIIEEWSDIIDALR